MEIEKAHELIRHTEGGNARTTHHERRATALVAEEERVFAVNRNSMVGIGVDDVLILPVVILDIAEKLTECPVHALDGGHVVIHIAQFSIEIECPFPRLALVDTFLPRKLRLRFRLRRDGIGNDWM